jgi:hypothetical protein
LAVTAARDNGLDPGVHYPEETVVSSAGISPTRLLKNVTLTLGHPPETIFSNLSFHFEK